MKIKWLGHSAFQIKSETSLVMDPYDPVVGKLPPELSAAVVTVSHGHMDHNYTEGVSGSPQIINQIGDFTTNGFEIKGIASYHDDESGKKRGNNIIYCISAEGMRLCHLGDLGHILTPEQLQEIGTVDILMIPVGGYYTIDANEAVQIVNQIKPRLVLPMHYKPKNSSIPFPIAGVDKFNELLGWNIVEEMNELKIDHQNLISKSNEIILFNI